VPLFLSTRSLFSGNAASAVTGQTLPVGNPQEKSKYNCSENKTGVFQYEMFEQSNTKPKPD
jgi:hypothetical protein